MVGGEIWANVWQTECIARICPQTGAVTGWLMLHGLGYALHRRGLGVAGKPMDVLNGGRLGGGRLCVMMCVCGACASFITVQ